MECLANAPTMETRKKTYTSVQRCLLKLHVSTDTTFERSFAYFLLMRLTEASISILIAVAFAHSIGCVRDEPAKSEAVQRTQSETTLLETLATSDAEVSVETLEQVKARGLKRHDLSLVHEAWNRRESLLQKLTANERRAVEVALADVLL